MEETNQSLTKEEYDALVSGKPTQGNEEKDSPNPELAQVMPTTENITKSKDKIAEVGANAKKRKVAKVIGEEQQEKEEDKKIDAKPTKKPKKKSKAVKLAFDDAES